MITNGEEDQIEWKLGLVATEKIAQRKHNFDFIKNKAFFDEEKKQKAEELAAEWKEKREEVLATREEALEANKEALKEQEEEEKEAEK